MKVIFDLDHTLFDMTTMHQNILVAMEMLNIDPEVYRKVYADATRWKIFTVEAIAFRLQREIGIDYKEVIQAFYDVVAQSRLFVYKDTEQHLLRLRDAGHELYLLSWGDEEWQQAKLSNTNLIPYFCEILTSYKMKAESIPRHWADLKKGVVLVDDRLAELKKVQDRFPNIHFIHIKRENGKYADQPTPMDMFKATDMAGVVEKINELSKNYIQI